MQAIAVFPGSRDVRRIDVEPPVLGAPGEVLLEPLEVGICGTDREIAAFHVGTPPPGDDYLVLGHETLCRVLEVGADVQSPRPGDLVVPMVRRPCPHPDCPACRLERQDFCFTGDFTERGIKERHGFMTGRVVDEARWMHVVPPALRDVGVLVEPLSIAEKALLQVADLQQRLPWACEVRRGEAPAARLEGQCHRALVLGAGPIGLLGALALVARGFDTTVYSRQPAGDPRADSVRAMGAHYVSSEDEDVAALGRRMGGIDLVYEATGASRLAFAALAALGTNGVLVFTGVPGRDQRFELDGGAVMRDLVLRNQVVLGTVNAGLEAFEAAIADLGEFVARWPAVVRGLVTGRHPLDAAPDLLRGKTPGIKDVVIPA